MLTMLLVDIGYHFSYRIVYNHEPENIVERLHKGFMQAQLTRLAVSVPVGAEWL